MIFRATLLQLPRSLLQFRQSPEADKTVCLTTTNEGSAADAPHPFEIRL